MCVEEAKCINITKLTHAEPNHGDETVENRDLESSQKIAAWKPSTGRKINELQS